LNQMLDWANIQYGWIRNILIGFQKSELRQMSLSNKDEYRSVNLNFIMDIIRFINWGYENERLRNYYIVTRFIHA